MQVRYRAAPWTPVAASDLNATCLGYYNSTRPANAQTGVMAEPITVSITRIVDPERAKEVAAWARAGQDLLSSSPGYLGSGWVRPDPQSPEWHMLFRFADADSLAIWEASPERAWWISTAEGLVEEGRFEKRTGIEGWFDAPTQSPPRWKQATSIWLGFFPVNLAFTLLVTAFIPGWNDLATVLKVLITTLVLTPIMAYWVLPWVTRMLRPWLVARRP